MPDTHRPHWETSVPVPVAWMRQFHYCCRTADKVRDLPGDFVECGVGHGTTFAMLAYLAGIHGRTLRGFDSFQGFPEPSPHDASWRNPQAGEWMAHPESVRRRLEESGIVMEFPNSPRRLVYGFLHDTLPREPHYPIALLHLDVDLHDSYRDALTHLFPRVVPGGIVMFDEYREYSKSHPHEEKWPGATDAIDEYLASLGLLRPERDGLAGKYFVVKP